MSPTSIDAPAEEPSVITNIVKPGWVKHGKRRIPIFSIDIHPDLSRFATGGQGDDGGLVLLWAMAAVYSEKNQRNPNVPKLLSRLENHSGCVNCVRWSPSGKALASGGDDKLVMIWRQSKSSFGSSGGGNTGFGGSEAVENWRVVATLRSHSEDVLGLAWSPLENQLASCSVDNTIVVWDATKWNQIITVLKGHSGLVKGVTYDPIGKFLASQGDDKTLRIWRTSDWACTATVSSPFEKTTGSTHVLRLDWSPDGNFIVSAHAMNGQAPVAKIVERNTWNCEKDFVGHRKAVCCVRFCPSLCYSRTGGKVMSLLAMGSRDKSISVWFTTSLRPVLVLEDVFQDSVLDISWSPNGRFLAACSADGSVVFLEFDQKLLGVALTNNDKEKLFKRLYGSVPTLSTTASTNQQAVVEDAALLTLATTDQNSHDKLTPEKPKPMANGSDAVFLSPQKAPLPVETSVPSGPSPAKPQQTITKQIETRTKEGKRRIQPIFIPPDDNNDEAPAPFIPEGAEDISMSSFTLERATSPSPTIEAKRKLEENTTAGPAKEKENHDTPVIKSTEDGGPPCSKKPRALLAGMGPLPDKEVLEKAVEETKVLGSNRVSSTVSSVSEGHLPQSDKPPVPVVMPLPAPQESGATISSTTAKESSSTASSVPPVKKQARLGVDYFPSHPLMTSKSSSKKISSAGTPAAALQATGSVASASVSSVVPTGLPQVSAAVEALGIEVLPKMQFKGSCSVRLAPSPSSQMLPLLIQAQNSAFSCAQTSVSLLRVSKDRSLTMADSSGLSSMEEESSSEVIWEQVFGTDLIGLVASEKLTCVASANGSLHLFATASGEREMPPIWLKGGPCHKMSLNEWILCVITTSGELYLWNWASDAGNRRGLVLKTSILHLLGKEDTSVHALAITETKAPLVAFLSGKGFVYSDIIGEWSLICDSRDAIRDISLVNSLSEPLSKPRQPLRPGSTLRRCHDVLKCASSPSSMRALVASSNQSLQRLCTLSQIDAELAAIQLMDSKQDFKPWLLNKVNFLLNNDMQKELRALCDDLLGPAHSSATTSKWEDQIMGHSKRELLREILPLFAKCLPVQRLCLEYKEQLDVLDRFAHSNNASR